MLSATNVRNGRLSWETSRFTTRDEYTSFARRLSLERGDVLLTIVGTIGRAAVLEDTPPPLVFQRSVGVVRPKPGRLDPRFLFYVTQSEDFQRQLARFTNKSSQAGVYLKKLKTAEIPLPSLPEQQRIAKILDAADALRSKRREALAQLDTLLQSVFLDMFGDPVANPKGWEARSLGELADNEDGKRVPIKKADRARTTGEFPYYGASGVIDFVDDYLFQGDRLLIGEDGANLLARATPIAFLATGRFWVNNHAHVLASNGSAELRFLEAMLNRMDLKPFISGSAQPKLNQKNLNRIVIPSPPLVLQRQFVRIVEWKEQQESLQRAHLAELDTLFSSLQSRAFRGDL